MDLQKLHSRLFNAYSDKNLNRITGKLIEIYKNRNYDSLRELAVPVSEYIPIDSDNDVKCFSILVMLYHPDKGEFYRKQIDSYYKAGDYDNLVKFSHVLKLDSIDKIKVNRLKEPEQVEDESEYVWEETNDGFGYYDNEYEAAMEDMYDEYTEEYENYKDGDEFIEDYRDEYTTNRKNLSFYDAVKLREYGKPDIEFPPYYLEDFEEINFADSQIDSLDGIAYCKHVVNLDLSVNNIQDISELSGLQNIKELYLADNNIGITDALSGLINLEILDLSHNDIDDISALFSLEKLQYVNLIGNNVPVDQINRIQKKNILVLG